MVPRFTDETEDMQFALKILHEGMRPLVSNDTYNGPLFHYLMAGGFGAGGGIEWPRQLALVAGVLTVALTYLLAFSVCDMALPARAHTARRPTVRLGAAIGALLLATSFIPVVVNSHIAWSNSTTPLWTTLALWLLVESVRRGNARLLVPAGFVGGLAQQTHPSVLAILAGGALWLAVTRPMWLRTRWPWLGVLAGLVAVGNIVWFNATTPGGSLAMVEERDYAYAGIASVGEFATNAAGFVRLAYQTIASAFVATIDETADPLALRAILLKPLSVIAGAAALAGVVYTAVRRAGPTHWLWLASLVLLPLFNQAYHHFILARYLSPLLPPTFASVGALLAAGMALGFDRAGREHGAARRTLGWAVSLASGALAAALVLGPVRSLGAFYVGQTAEGKTNARLLQAVASMEALGREGEPVLLDRALRHTRLTAGGNLLNVPDGLLDVAGIPNDRVKERDQPDLPTGAVILMSDAQRDAVSSELELVPVPWPGTPAPASPAGYGVYRVGGRAPP
jgi:4-amino-4-deoxy-L-arabinose transferase-like glycosyltransferase